MKVFDWIASHAARSPGKLAQIDWHTGRRYTYTEMHERVARIAGFLRHELGVQRGDRVAMLSLSGTDVFDLQFACARLGAILCPLNNRLALAELEYIIDDLAPCVLICDDSFAESGQRLLEHYPRAVLINIERETRIDNAEAVYRMVDQQDSDTWIILYTSGTTGLPKGVCLHHGMITANILGCTGPTRLTRDSVNLCFAPLFHTGGLNIFANPCYYLGGTNITLNAFDPALVLELLGNADLGVTHFIGVPAMFQMIASEPAFRHTDFRRIVAPLIGGAPAPPALLEEYASVGLQLIHAYGMTEAGPMVLMLDAETALAKPGSSGKTAINIDLRLVRKDGEDATGQEIGEVWLRGEAVTRGYWNKPEATAEVFSDAWLRTGDAAYRDTDGFFYIADRWKNMYISGGENVYPAEVEKVIYAMDEVFEVAVIGRPDEKWGETGVAYVVLHPGATLSRAAVVAHCRDRLAGYKLPSEVLFLDELPHNATGKILRHELAASRTAHNDGSTTA